MSDTPFLIAKPTQQLINDNYNASLEEKVSAKGQCEYNSNVDSAGYSIADHLRSEKEIVDFLVRYMFKLSNSDVLNIYFVTPLSIFLNITFILYNMYAIFIVHDNIYNDYNENTESYLLICAEIVTGFEFGGLCILLITLFYTYIFVQKTENYATFIDLIELIGSWSAFKLFYECRPTAIFQHVSTVIKNNTDSRKQYCKTLQREIDIVKEPVYDIQLKTQLRNELQDQCKNAQPSKKRGLKRFMTESAYGLVIFVLFIGLGFGILSLLLKLSQLNFITTKPIKDWTVLNFFYCLGFSNQLWNMVNIDQLKSFTIYEFLYTNNRNVDELTSKKLKNILYLDSLIKTILHTQYGWRGVMISIYMPTSYILQILIKNPFQSNKPYTLKEYQQHNKRLQNVNIQHKRANETEQLETMFHKLSINDIDHDSDIEYGEHSRSMSIVEHVNRAIRKTTEVVAEENQKWKDLLNSYVSDLKLESYSIKDPISEAQLFLQENKCGNKVEEHISIKINSVFKNFSYLFEMIEDWLEKLFIVVIIAIMISCIATSVLCIFYYHNLGSMNALCQERLIWISLCITLILMSSLLFIFICHECQPDNTTTDKLLRLNAILVALSIVVTFCIFMFYDKKCVEIIAKDRHYNIIHIAVLTNFSLLMFLLLPIFIHLLFHPFYIIIAVLSIIGSITMITDAVFTFAIFWFVIQNFSTFKHRYQNYDFLDICDINLTLIAVIVFYYVFNILLCFKQMTSTNTNKLYAPKCVRYMTSIVYIILIGLLVYDDIYLSDSTCDYWENHHRMYIITKYSAGYNCIFWCLTFLICLPANILKEGNHLERIKQISDFFMYHSAFIFCIIIVHLAANVTIVGLSSYLVFNHYLTDIKYDDFDVVYICMILMIVFFILETIFDVVERVTDKHRAIVCVTYMKYVVMVSLELLYLLMIVISILGIFDVIKWPHEFNKVEYNMLMVSITILLCGQFIGMVTSLFRVNENTEHWHKMINHTEGPLNICRLIFFTVS